MGVIKGSFIYINETDKIKKIMFSCKNNCIAPHWEQFNSRCECANSQEVPRFGLVKVRRMSHL